MRIAAVFSSFSRTSKKPFYTAHSNTQWWMEPPRRWGARRRRDGERLAGRAGGSPPGGGYVLRKYSVGWWELGIGFLGPTQCIGWAPPNSNALGLAPPPNTQYPINQPNSHYETHTHTQKCTQKHTPKHPQIHTQKHPQKHTHTQKTPPKHTEKQPKNKMSTFSVP